MELATSWIEGDDESGLKPMLIDGEPVVLSHRLTVATVWLLAEWTRGQGPAWRAELMTGTAPRFYDELWLDHDAIIRYEPRPEGIGIDRLRPEHEAIAETEAWLSAHIPATGRGAALRDHLARILVGWHQELFRIDDATLLVRDSDGNLLRLAFGPGSSEVLSLPTHLSCLATLLSDLLWVNNNNAVEFRTWVLPRTEHDDPAAARAAWLATREDPEYTVDPSDVTPVTTDQVRACMSLLAAGVIDDFQPESEDERPAAPPDHIVSHLADDLIHLVLARAADRTGLFHVGLALHEWPTPIPDDEEVGTYLFVTPAEVIVLDTDLTC
jgi:hypothetical protein